MLTRSQILHSQNETNRHWARINETFARREAAKGRVAIDKAWSEWEEATDAWHKSENQCFYLWPLNARDRMRTGDREVIEDALLFLEVNPWFFRSGYLKERVLKHLKSALLNENDRERLREIIRSVLQGRNPRELRDYCRLALVVWTPQWEAQLRADYPQRSVKSHGKYNYLLRFLDHHRDKLRA